MEIFTTVVDNVGVLIYATLLYTSPLLFASLGSCFSENCGIVNIGIEGMMIGGAFTGATLAHLIGHPWLSFLMAGLVGALFGLLHAFATVTLNADQTIAGTAINFIAPGLSLLLSRTIFGGATDTPPIKESNMIPVLFKDVFKGDTVFSRFMKNIFNIPATAYLVFLVLIIVWFIFYKTPFGLRLRAVGEHPRACDTLGINVSKMRYIAVIVSGFLSGLGGACVTMSIMNQFRPVSIVGQGFIAIAAVLFGKFKPQGAVLGCLLFGFCTGLKVVLGQNEFLSAQLISMIPYIVTIIMLVLFVKKSGVPSASGKPYIK